VGLEHGDKTGLTARRPDDVPEKGNPSILKLPQSSVLICANVRFATFLPTYGYISSPSETGCVSRHLVASIISSCHTITAPSFVRPQSNSRDVTPSFRPIANAGRVLIISIDLDHIPWIGMERKSEKTVRRGLTIQHIPPDHLYELAGPIY